MRTNRASENEELEGILEANPFLGAIAKWEEDLCRFHKGEKQLAELSFVLESDKGRVADYQSHVAKRTASWDSFLHPEVLPQPFIGDPRAPVWFLLLNPGYSFPDRYDHLGVCSFCERKLIEGCKSLECTFERGRDRVKSLKQRQQLLLNQLLLRENSSFYMLDESFNTLPDDATFKKKGGYNWWRTVLFGASNPKGFLLHECGVKQDPIAVGKKIFVLECAPYHSQNFNKKVLWKESGYTKFWISLISWAVKTNRKFIVRSERIADLLKQYGLQVGETNSLRFSSDRNVSMTKRNLKGQAAVMDAVCGALSGN